MFVSTLLMTDFWGESSPARVMTFLPKSISKWLTPRISPGVTDEQPFGWSHS
jgi:hypothetical protein